MSEEDAKRELPEITKERLIAALETLPRLQRDVYLAAAMEGLSYAEMGRQTGLSIGGVERTLAKALVILSRALDQPDQGG